MMNKLCAIIIRWALCQNYSLIGHFRVTFGIKISPDCWGVSPWDLAHFHPCLVGYKNGLQQFFVIPHLGGATVPSKGTRGRFEGFLRILDLELGRNTKWVITWVPWGVGSQKLFF